MRFRANWGKAAVLVVGLVVALGTLLAQEAGKKSSSYSPVVIQEDFATVMSRMSAAKPAIMQRQKALLEERYDLSDRPARGVTMSRGKAVQEGVRVKLRGGMTWERLAQMRPEEIRGRDVFPLGFMPLPHPNHPEGGMLFPKYQIDEIKKQEGRDLTRFDLDFDLPDHIMPEFPPAIWIGEVKSTLWLRLKNCWIFHRRPSLALTAC
jgi:cytochrome c peroxidase